MNMRWMLAGLVVVVALGKPTLAAAQDKPFVWKEGKLEIQLPGEPKQGKNELKLEKDGGKVVYLVTFSDIPKADKVTDEQRALLVKSIRESIVKSLDGKLLSEKDIKSGEHAGNEFRVESAAGLYRTHVFLVNGRLYQLVVIGPPDVSTGKEAETFFKSLKFAK
jgi:hypothetical protein